MIVMATSCSDVVKRVTRLKFQLGDSAESKTILKTLQKLKDLDMTLEVLIETGIGKTVNSFRKHKQAGELAKSLVAYWKKLVPKDSTSHTAEGENTPSSDLKAKTRDQNCQENGKLPNGGVSNCNANSQDGSSDVMMTDGVTDKETPLEGEDQDVLDADLNKKMKTQDKKRNSTVKSPKTNHINVGNSHIVPRNKNDDSESRSKSRANSNGISDAGKIGAKRDSRHHLQNGKRSTLKVETEESSSKTWSKSISSEDDEDSEIPNGSQNCHEKNSQPVEEKRKSKNEENPNTKAKKSKIKDKAKINDDDLDVPPKAPSESFESFLSYDMNPRKKDRHRSRNSHKKFKSAKKDELPKELCTKSVKLPTMSENDLSSKKGFEMNLLPLPAHLPELYDKPSTVVDYFQRKQKIQEEVEETTEDASTAIGQRLNKRMQVYSGAKSNFLPTMMSLYQQCVRTLQNNLDMLYETGGVPFEIMEPVLERCTPNQLLRIEECNPVYIGETDHLWEKHCKREFRDSKLLEYESWKEMYIRLSEERERKFKRLTKTIASAHSTKPKGRQVKMAFIHTVAKPPRDVRLQQEIHKSKGESLTHKVKSRISSDSVQKHVLMNTTKVTIERSYDEQYKNEQYKSGTSSSGINNAQDPRKKTRVAPMMAKSLKAFKKHLGRR